MNYKTVTACRLCGCRELRPVFSLGTQFVSDFVDADRVTAGVRCPIDLVLCPTCTLVQQLHTAPQDFLYTRHYWYRSSVTTTMREALWDVAAKAEYMVRPKDGDVVLDIGSNDGCLLRSYTTGGIVRVGVEPAINLAEEGARGVDVFINEFWNAGRYFDHMNMAHPGIDAGRECVYSHRAKIVTAIGMFYDLDRPNDFIRDVARALHPEGLFVAQLMCLKNMLAMADVGNLSHEHLEFYSLRSLQHLFGKHGLELFDVETNSVNGESYRLYVRHKGSKVGEENGIGFKELRRAERVKKALAEEVQWGLDDASLLCDRMSLWTVNRDRCVTWLQEQKAAGKSIWILGASTKGSVISQWYGLDRSLIDGASERDPQKWGKFMVGSGIKIHPEQYARDAKPDVMVVLPYAFRAEIIERERQFLAEGGKLVFPLPEFQVIGG